MDAMYIDIDTNGVSLSFRLRSIDNKKNICFRNCVTKD